MRRGVAVGMGCALLLAGVSAAYARGERELSQHEFHHEMRRNKALAAYVARNGEPDFAEAHFLADDPPWDDHEVTIYYLAARKELGFARAYILGQPEIQILRYERPLTEEQVAALTSRARAAAHQAPAAASAPVAPSAATTEAAAAPPPEPAAPLAEPQTASLSPAERAELAAERAESAAGRVEMAADSAERAADRAEAIAEKAASSVHRGARK